jgi:hypothetical protein
VAHAIAGAFEQAGGIAERCAMKKPTRAWGEGVGAVAARGNAKPLRPFMTGTKLYRMSMQNQTIIERAFELARGSANIDDIRKVLRKEGYANVDAHLGGASIKAELKRQFVR